MQSLLHSRKFWLMVFDVIISTVTYLVTNFVSPELAKTILWLIGSWQPVMIAVIIGIATEDSANIAAGNPPTGAVVIPPLPVVSNGSAEIK